MEIDNFKMEIDKYKSIELDKEKFNKAAFVNNLIDDLRDNPETYEVVSVGDNFNRCIKKNGVEIRTGSEGDYARIHIKPTTHPSKLHDAYLYEQYDRNVGEVVRLIWGIISQDEKKQRINNVNRIAKRLFKKENF